MRKACAHSSILLINDIAQVQRQQKIRPGKNLPAAGTSSARIQGFRRGRRIHARSTTTAATTAAIETIALGIHSVAALVRAGATASWIMRFNTLRVVCCATAEVLSVCRVGAL